MILAVIHEVKPHSSRVVCSSLAIHTISLNFHCIKSEENFFGIFTNFRFERHFSVVKSQFSLPIDAFIERLCNSGVKRSKENAVLVRRCGLLMRRAKTSHRKMLFNEFPLQRKTSTSLLPIVDI